MSEGYDRFIININESSGKIKRNPFTFRYDDFEVLKDDSLILKDTTPSRIRGVLENENLRITIVGNATCEYLNKTLDFDTISTDINNIRWKNKRSVRQNKPDSDTPDYMALFYKNGILTKVSFVNYETGVVINFFSNKYKGLLKPLPQLCLDANKANSLYKEGKLEEVKSVLYKIYHSVQNDPKQLKFVEHYEGIGKSFLLMLILELSDDIDTLQFIVSIGYLCTSLALEDSEDNINIYVDRLLLLNYGNVPFRYTVMEALSLISSILFSPSNNLADLKARDAIYKMEMIDLENNPILCSQIDFFNERKKELEEMIEDDFFLPDRTKEKVLTTGISNHRSLITFLEDKVIVNGNVDF